MAFPSAPHKLKLPKKTAKIFILKATKNKKRKPSNRCFLLDLDSLDFPQNIQTTARKCPQKKIL